MKDQWLVSGFTSLVWLAGISMTQAQDVSLAQVEEVASRLEGVMETLPSRTDAQRPTVRMTSCRVQVSDSGVSSVPASVFLYQEQSLSTNLQKPYRQRFLQLSFNPYSKTIQSRSFKPESLTAWIGFCQRSTPERVVKKTDLGRSVCTVFLRQSGDNFIGQTPVDGCPANYRGATRITNYIVLSKTGMDTWDRGYDANHQQVWGAKTESYQFRKISVAP